MKANESDLSPMQGKGQIEVKTIYPIFFMPHFAKLEVKLISCPQCGEKQMQISPKDREIRQALINKIDELMPEAHSPDAQ